LIVGFTKVERCFDLVKQDSKYTTV